MKRMSLVSVLIASCWIVYPAFAQSAAEGMDEKTANAEMVLSSNEKERPSVAMEPSPSAPLDNATQKNEVQKCFGPISFCRTYFGSK